MSLRERILRFKERYDVPLSIPLGAGDKCVFTDEAVDMIRSLPYKTVATPNPPWEGPLNDAGFIFVKEVWGGGDEMPDTPGKRLAAKSHLHRLLIAYQSGVEMEVFETTPAKRPVQVCFTVRTVDDDKPYTFITSVKERYLRRV